LGKFGANWFESSDVADELIRPPANFIEAPRRYGFHATLKAPMRLESASDYRKFRNAVKDISGQQKSLNIGVLSLQTIGNFLALVTEDQYHDAVSDLAWTCTTQLDHFRAPLNQAERNKRTNLSTTQTANLEKWGYPYVGENFRFHMTLTSALESTELSRAKTMLQNILPNEQTIIDSICIFGDPGSLKPFELLERFRLSD